MHLVFFFFFSSRRRHTRLVSDWSSDVCSSDLLPFTKKRELSPGLPPASPGSVALPHWTPRGAHLRHSGFGDLNPTPFRSAEGNGGHRPSLRNGARRSEERRVGKECRSRWSRYH